MNRVLSGITKRIRPINIQTMNFKMSHRLFVFFIMGIGIGTVLINFFAGDYYTELSIYSEYAMNNLTGSHGQSIDRSGFFLYCFRKYFTEVIIIIGVNCMAVWKTFDSLYCMYKGMVISILISTATLNYGAGGLLLYIISVFPHYLAYVPLVIFTLYFGVSIRRKLLKEKRIMAMVKGVGVEVMLMGMSALLEAYVNYPIVRGMFK